MQGFGKNCPVLGKARLLYNAKLCTQTAITSNIHIGLGLPPTFSQRSR